DEHITSVQVAKFSVPLQTEDSGKGKKREGKKSLLQVDGVVKSPMSMAYQVFPLVIEDFPTLFSATKSR
ncbi:hypothetical protein OM322_19635, partial [Escherichia albertii]|nr:hypothetical protein [Escherichia albertii]